VATEVGTRGPARPNRRCSPAASAGTLCTVSTPRKPRARPNAWQQTFLKAFEETLTVRAACEAAGIAYRTAYQARQRDEEFALAWADAERAVVQRAEDQLHELATAGPPIGEDSKRDQVRLRANEIILRARAPERYGRQHVELSGGVKLDQGHLKGMAEDELRRLAGLE